MNFLKRLFRFAPLAFVVFGVIVVVPLIQGQVGPTVFTPRLTVSPGPLTVTTGDTTVEDLIIEGTCTGCTTTPPGGANTQVQYNNSGAFGGDAGLTYVAGTDTLSTGTLTAATAVTVAGQNVCQANGTNCATQVAGSNTQVQFNNSGAFGADAGLTFNSVTDGLGVTGLATVGGLSAGNDGITVTGNGASALGNSATLDTGGVIGLIATNFRQSRELTGFTATVNCDNENVQYIDSALGTTPDVEWSRIIFDYAGGTTCRGTSNATTMTMTVTLSPTVTGCVTLPVIDNGAVVQGNVCISSAGTATFGVGLSGAGGFTASGTKGIPSNYTIVY